MYIYTYKYIQTSRCLNGTFIVGWRWLYQGQGYRLSRYSLFFTNQLIKIAKCSGLLNTKHGKFFKNLEIPSKTSNINTKKDKLHYTGYMYSVQKQPTTSPNSFISLSKG